LPIVAFDIEWHGELVRPGETGFLADFADTHHLARQLTTALDRPDDARRMAAACRTLALQMFDPKRVRAEERRHYAMLLEQPAGERVRCATSAFMARADSLLNDSDVSEIAQTLSDTEGAVLLCLHDPES
jgi:hypothetical protein